MLLLIASVSMNIHLPVISSSLHTFTEEGKKVFGKLGITDRIIVRKVFYSDKTKGLPAHLTILILGSRVWLCHQGGIVHRTRRSLSGNEIGGAGTVPFPTAGLSTEEKKLQYSEEKLGSKHDASIGNRYYIQGIHGQAHQPEK